MESDKWVVRTTRLEVGMGSMNYEARSRCKYSNGINGLRRTGC